MDDLSEAKVAQWMQSETLAEHLIPLLDRYDVKWRGHGVIYVDHEEYNIHTAHMIVTDLSATFGVSAELVRSRLIELQLLRDVRDILPVRDQAARIVARMPSRADDASDEDHCDMAEEYPDA
ncbi:hypothetical protein [Pseudomonas sp. COR18]|uniref:hypothetical protein n=1 Tax=Pseudomonas sp. COR18 TaxID=3399680 RepID=UPI003AFF9FA7